MKIENGNFYSFKIKDRKQEEQGVLLAEGEDWILLMHLFTDYILDGCMLINKNYIKSINRDEKIIFKEIVLKANNKIKITENIEIPLSTNQLFNWLNEERVVFQIENKSEQTCWIGEICGLTEKSIFLAPLTPLGVWNASVYYTFRKMNVRLISFDSDYINSLLTYNKMLK